VAVGRPHADVGNGSTPRPGHPLIPRISMIRAETRELGVHPLDAERLKIESRSRIAATTLCPSTTRFPTTYLVGARVAS
jgi:hypothetical protein